MLFLPFPPARRLTISAHPTDPVSQPAPAAIDQDEANTNELNPLVPRPIDMPTDMPVGGKLAPEIGDIAKVFAAPYDPAEWPAWREALSAWRTEARNRLSYSGAAYEATDAHWARSCYSVAQVWLWDERLFDHSGQRFTVDAFLDSTADHGGFDGVVLWHAYPIIGIDNRNQFDFYRDVPGLTDVVERFHERGLRVFLDYNPWDTGTFHAEREDPEELAALTTELGVDGVFLDTMKEGNSRLVTALQGTQPPQVLEGESRVPNPRIEDHHLSWAQWFADSTAPGVMRAHWYERRHMMHSIRRWNRDHSDELQSAWMNGTGMLVWDAVFGIWVGWNERDKSTLRRMLRVQRALTDVLVDGDWAPLADGSTEAVAEGVYVSRFEHGPLTLWTVINRGTNDYRGEAIAPLSGIIADGGSQAFDVSSGHRLHGSSIWVPSRGVTGVLAVAGGEPEWLDGLLEAAAADAHSGDAAFPARPAVRVTGATTAVPNRQPDAVAIAPGTYDLTITYRRRETGIYGDTPYLEEWKPLPPRLHDARSEQREVRIGRSAVALREVTRGEYLEFLRLTGYRPAVDNRFIPDRDADTPLDAAVTNISLDDARAYARWTGARLPDEFEWQVAAADQAFQRREPVVWNWTESEHTDGITPFAILKGGSEHESIGADWYVDGGVKPPSFSLKLLLAGMGVERSSNIGFRLAWDMEEK